MRRSLSVVALTLLLAGCQEQPLPLAPEEADLQRGPAGAMYEVVDLGTLGGTSSLALGISRNGQVVGTSRTTGSTRPQFAFHWLDGEMVNLGSLPGSTFSRAFKVNEVGVAVGEAFTPSPERSRAVMWRNGSIVDLGTLPGATGAVANDINNRGQVAGASGIRAFLWEDGEMRDLGAVSEAEDARSRGNAINERGQVVGSSQTEILTSSGSRATHATLWDRGRAIDLGTLGEPTDFSVAFGLNARTEVVGESVVGRVGTTTVYHAFLWSGSRMVDLHPTALGLRHSRANAINEQGEAVGHASGFFGFPTIDGKAVLWRNGVAVDLNQRISGGSGWVLRSAEGIDAAGHIVGYGSFGGQTRAFLLVPMRGR
ncbi:MAG: hypothetical protein H0V12_06085 [Chloroflexi bacterium]|nr:hypothetical protein [Chloroflexota bacterium]